MNIFISGASGLVGGNCLRYFSSKGLNVIGTYFSYPTEGTVYFNTLDLNDPKNPNLDEFMPNVIIHCGALTHVDYCESHEDESYEKTVQSTQHLLALAEKYQAKLVYISTDYVFDGLAGPYSEHDSVGPLSIYAQHKLKAEQMVLAASEKHLVLRITNVYGDEDRNKNFVARIISQCIADEKLTLKLPYDQYATPVNAHDIARALYLLLRDQQKGIFHIAGTDWMNRVELALTILKYYPKAAYTLEAVSTPELKQPANRPLRGGLLKSKFSALYPEFLFSNVDDYVRSKINETTSVK